ncbi:hypothetical protein I7I53_06715 [Histoplasma capsulatum var. duboisii H88]|uniref:Uncharacterized protein n=1 Tax=Ajellomyces capsulatus (strain H88) TaxID=544711 RepID=A0A8A1LFH0_AJEC8|nr:hypothetical protein I7I53_06715 [Histoplasma capsulatum var. duboisii H88]
MGTGWEAKLTMRAKQVWEVGHLGCWHSGTRTLGPPKTRIISKRSQKGSQAMQVAEDGSPGKGHLDQGSGCFA